MSIFQQVLGANDDYANTFQHGDLAMPPSRGVAILTCMDGRLDPAKFLGLMEGEAHVIRNAGGRASEDAIRSLVISSHLLGTREFLVIHHTDCGMLTFGNEDLRRKLQSELGADASSLDFLPFKNLEQSVRNDVESIASSPFLSGGIPVSGLVYDVRNGRVNRITSIVTRGARRAA